jgi:hypothetical protein
MLTDQGIVTQGGHHEQIGSTTSANEMPGDLLSVSHHVLGRGRFVVDIAGVDIGAVLKQEIGNLDRPREMKGRLAISSAGMDQFGPAREQFTKRVDATESGGGMGIHDGTALNCVVGEFGRATIEQTESAGPPPAAGVDIGAGFEKRVQDFRGARVNNGGRVERSDRFIDLRFQFGMAREVFADQPGIVLMESGPEVGDGIG